MKKTIFRSLALTAIGSLCLVGSASAIPITGEIGLSGTISNVDLATVTGLTFTGPASVLVATGIFAELNTFAEFLSLSLPPDSATMQNFTFSPLAPSPVAPLWTITDNDSSRVFSFDLSSVTVVTQDASALVLNGSGTMYATGYDATFGDWSFSTQDAGGTADFTWSSANVPEPASMLIFGAGLMGLVGVRTLRRKE